MLDRIRLLFHVHWFTEVWNSYAYAYKACRCGQRRATPLRPGCHAPLAMWWLEGRSAPHSSTMLVAEVRSGVSGVR